MAEEECHLMQHHQGWPHWWGHGDTWGERWKSETHLGKSIPGRKRANTLRQEHTGSSREDEEARGAEVRETRRKASEMRSEKMRRRGTARHAGLEAIVRLASTLNEMKIHWRILYKVVPWSDSYFKRIALAALMTKDYRRDLRDKKAGPVSCNHQAQDNGSLVQGGSREQWSGCVVAHLEGRADHFYWWIGCEVSAVP